VTADSAPSPKDGGRRPQLETARLILRPVQEGDAERIQELASAREVAATTLRIPHPYPADGGIEFVKMCLSLDPARGECPFAIVPRGSEGLIGLCGLEPEFTHRQSEMGYWIGVPYWGRGYATEAAAALLRFAFLDLDLHRVHAAYFSNNPASGRVMEKLGMRFEGIYREHILKYGEFLDLHVYAILRREWQERAPGKVA